MYQYYWPDLVGPELYLSTVSSFKCTAYCVLLHAAYCTQSESTFGRNHGRGSGVWGASQFANIPLRQYPTSPISHFARIPLRQNPTSPESHFARIPLRHHPNSRVRTWVRTSATLYIRYVHPLRCPAMFCHSNRLSTKSFIGGNVVAMVGVLEKVRFEISADNSSSTFQGTQDCIRNNVLRSRPKLILYYLPYVKELVAVTW